MRRELQHKFIGAVKYDPKLDPKDTGFNTYPDKGIRGFELRVTKGGTKTCPSVTHQPQHLRVRVRGNHGCDQTH